MKVFISWSGTRSRAVALALRDWLPDVIQEARPFMSENDIGAGARWAGELSKTLEGADLGILCLTPENLLAPWLVFEAGSLSKKLDASRVVPYRLGVKATEVPFPIAQFQSIDANRDGTLKMLQTLNGARKQPMERERLERLFSRLWRDLDEDLKAALALESSHAKMRGDRELLEEILGLVRNYDHLSFYRTMAAYHDRAFEHVDVEDSRSLCLLAEVYWHEAGFSRDEALEFCGVLKHNSIQCRLAEHKDKRPPDAVFIGALVPADAARTVLLAVPYEIKHLFRPDYPEEQGGSGSGLKVGVGYRSTHLSGNREASAEPVPVSAADLARLTEGGISSVEFHRRLRETTGMS